MMRIGTHRQCIRFEGNGNENNDKMILVDNHVWTKHLRCSCESENPDGTSKKKNHKDTKNTKVVRFVPFVPLWFFFFSS